MIYIDNVQDDTIAVAVASNASAVTQELEIDCFDGETFSIDNATDFAAIRFKHEDDVSYTNIEAGTYDLSPHAPGRKTFLIEADPDETAFLAYLALNPTERQVVVPLRFRVGPLVPVIEYSIVYNDSNNEIYNDSEDLVYTEV